MFLRRSSATCALSGELNVNDEFFISIILLLSERKSITNGKYLNNKKHTGQYFF